MIALLDLDIFCYRVGFTTEEEPDYIAASRIDTMIEECLIAVQATEHKGFLTGSSNFRKDIYPEYKANRVQAKPKHLNFLKDHLTANWGATQVEKLEADDLLAMNQDYYGTNGIYSTVLCSIDKDLLTVPGYHYNFVKKEFTTIDYLEGTKRFYKQFLTGDKADNIIGIAGIGPVGANKLIDHLTNELDMFNIVKSIYNDDERFLMNGRCLWMKRTAEDDWKDQYNNLLVIAEGDLL